jgi:translation initiation factor IF-2
MSETHDDKSSAKPTLMMAKPDRLSLTKTVEGGRVTQNFTHGRSKQVMVEVKKTRTFTRKEGAVSMEQVATKPTQQAENLFSGGMSQADLASLQVRDRRQIDKASSEVKAPEIEKPQEVITPIEEKHVAGAVAKVSEAAKPLPSAQELRRPKMIGAEKPKTAAEIEKEAENSKLAKKKIGLKADDNRRSSNKLTVAQALEYQEERMRSLASIKRQRSKGKLDLNNGKQEKIFREVIIPEAITVQELANRMAERVADVIRSLMKMGTIAAASQSIDADTAELIVGEFGHTFRRVTDADVENILSEEAQDTDDTLLPRPPVVTIMGHVDHGKTSLLDALRETSVVAGEAGGITQHIGAYQIEANGQKVTFLDTPGHEAFTAMRSRGAKATDIVVLVVAADDGIMAQTEEAISHAKAAGVPIVVAINKMDKPNADPLRVKNELMQFGLVTEEFGGDTPTVEVSAKTRAGLDLLTETLLLQAEVMELKANPNRRAAGVVIESKIDKGRGITSTLLVQNGTLSIGDIVVAGSAWGKVRAIVDDKNRTLKTAVASQPIEVLGLSEPPMAGEAFAVVESEKTARDITEYRIKKEKERQVSVTAKTLDQLFTAAGGSALKELNIILKGDVQGSVEAILGSLKKFNGDEVQVKVVHSAVGAISESDISLAQATGAIVFGFNVRAVGGAKALAEKEKIDVRYYSVIYDLVDDVRDGLSGMLSPERREDIIGYAEIRDVFNITKVGKVAGCYVTEGEIRRGAGVRLLRDNVVIHEGKLKTLKRFKDEVREVKHNYECGMAFENYDNIKAGDMIEAYEVKEIARRVTG